MGLSRDQRVRRGADFRRALRAGMRCDGRLFVLVVRRNGGDRARLGVSVGRRIGGAVERNRVKRLLREAFRQGVNQDQPIDAVVLAKPGVVGCQLRDISGELQRRLTTWGRRQAEASRRSQAGAGPR